MIRPLPIIMLMATVLLILPLSKATGCSVYAQTEICAHCLPGYFLTTNYTCSSCMSGCLQCITTANCVLCTSNFTLIDNICTPGPPHCLIVNNSNCQRCAIGYELTTNNTCRVCPNFCAQCNQGICITCNYGFGTAANDSQCLLCGNNCSQCQQDNNTGNMLCTLCMEGFYTTADNGCQACPEQCEVCKAYGCQSCSLGYYVQGLTCQACPQGCFDCQAQDNCTSCNDGYFYQNTLIPLQNACLPCLVNCMSCPDSNSCEQCEPSYYLSSNSSCAPCDLFCLNCLAPSQCTECLPSYYQLNGLCELCPQPCASCQDPTTCSSCVSNQYLLQYGQCIGCGQVIEGCLNCSSSTLCINCNEGYQLEQGRCVTNSGLTAGWIVVIVLASLLLIGAIGAGVYFLWRRRRGFMGGDQPGQSSQLRATYYQIP